MDPADSSAGPPSPLPPEESLSDAENPLRRPDQIEVAAYVTDSVRHGKKSKCLVQAAEFVRQFNRRPSLLEYALGPMLAEETIGAGRHSSL